MKSAIKILPIIAMSSFAMEWAWQALFYEGQSFAADLYHYRYVVGFTITSLYFMTGQENKIIRLFGFLGFMSGLSRLAYRIIRDLTNAPDYTNNSVWWVFFTISALILIVNNTINKKWKRR